VTVLEDWILDRKRTSIQTKGLGLEILGNSFIAILISVATLAGADDLTLADAAKNRDKDAVRLLLEQQPGGNAAQADRDTALHWAVYWDDLEMAKLLIRAGANNKSTNDHGVTPLVLACRNGNDAIVEMLLDSGSDPNQAAFPNSVTPLMMCARTGRVDAVKFLLDNGAKPNVKETRLGQTALMWAIAQGHAQTADLLIQHGADIHARSESGFTSLIFAARTGEAASARVLLAAGADVNVKVSLGAHTETPDLKTPAALMTPLLMATASGHEEISKFLVENGADPNVWDGGAAPIHYAVMEGLSYFHYRPSMNELVQVLLAHGADPNVRFERTIVTTRGYDTDNIPGRGATPFLMAAAAPDPELMRILLAAGADPNLTTSENVTALMAAAGVTRSEAYTEIQQRDALEAIRMIVELGADVNATSDIGRTALHGATQMVADPIIQYLAEQGVDVNARDIYQQTPLSAAMGIRLPWVRSNPLGEEGAVRQSTVDLLLSLGATPLDTPGYFKPMGENSEEYRFIPRQTTAPGLN
jgi:uncharacterized protein